MAIDLEAVRQRAARRKGTWEPSEGARVNIVTDSEVEFRDALITSIWIAGFSAVYTFRVTVGQDEYAIHPSSHKFEGDGKPIVIFSDVPGTSVIPCSIEGITIEDGQEFYDLKIVLNSHRIESIESLDPTPEEDILALISEVETLRRGR